MFFRVSINAAPGKLKLCQCLVGHVGFDAKKVSPQTLNLLVFLVQVFKESDLASLFHLELKNLVI
jgi:hypothetical protein